ncbi:MAG: acetoacetate decarboxylase family protein [Bacteroidia bacterium]
MAQIITNSFALCFLFISQNLIGQTFSKLYDLPPYHYVGSELISISFKTSQETINKLVPKPLEANTEGLINLDLYIQRTLPPTEWTYHEMVLSIPSKYNEKVGSYMYLLYLDQTEPIAAGREVWGFPKLDASFEFKMEGNSCHIKIKRDGDLLLTLDLDLGEANDTISEGSDGIGFVLKEIPASDGSSIPDVKKLNSYSSTNVKIYGYREGDNVRLSLNEHPKHGLEMIPILEIKSSYYAKCDFILGYGETLYDYLKLSNK